MFVSCRQASEGEPFEPRASNRNVTGPRSAGIKDDVEAASDARAVLGARASDMLDFGGIGLNCKIGHGSECNGMMMTELTLPRCNAASTFSQDGRAAGVTFKRLSRSTRYERGNLRDVNKVSRCGVLLNPGYDDTSRSSRSTSVPFPSSSLNEAVLEPSDPGWSPCDAQWYGRRKKISLCKIMPRDHISDFESVGGRVRFGRMGSDSGELYSRLGDNVS